MANKRIQMTMHNLQHREGIVNALLRSQERMEYRTRPGQDREITSEDYLLSQYETSHISSDVDPSELSKI